MDELLQKIEDMRSRCGWDRTDTVATMIKSVAVEAAELLETIQWDEEKYDADKVAQESADVLMYALTICRLLNRDPYDVITEKIKNVEARYPAVPHD